MKRLLLLITFLAVCARPAFAGPVSVAAGATSQCFEVTALDSTSTAGALKTGLAYSDMTCRYYRQNAGTGSTSITMATSTLGTYTSGAFKEIASSTGHYEFCPPDAALASAAGVNWVGFFCSASGTVPIQLDVLLVKPDTFGYDGQLASKSGTTLGLATGAIDADNQFVDTHMIVFFDSAGLVSASSCIEGSANAGDTITTREDISALISVNDNYIIKPDGGCSVPLSFSPGAGSGNDAEDWLIILRKRRLS